MTTEKELKSLRDEINELKQEVATLTGYKRGLLEMLRKAHGRKRAWNEPIEDLKPGDFVVGDNTCGIVEWVGVGYGVRLGQQQLCKIRGKSGTYETMLMEKIPCHCTTACVEHAEKKKSKSSKETRNRKTASAAASRTEKRSKPQTLP